MYRTYAQSPSLRFRGSFSPGDDNAVFLIISMATEFHRTKNILNSTVLRTRKQENDQRSAAQYLMAFEQSWPQDHRTKHILFFSACLCGLTS